MARRLYFTWFLALLLMTALACRRGLAGDAVRNEAGNSLTGGFMQDWKVEQLESGETLISYDGAPLLLAGGADWEWAAQQAARNELNLVGQFKPKPLPPFSKEEGQGGSELLLLNRSAFKGRRFRVLCERERSKDAALQTILDTPQRAKSETWNPKSETRNPKSETRNTNGVFPLRQVRADEPEVLVQDVSKLFVRSAVGEVSLDFNCVNLSLSLVSTKAKTIFIPRLSSVFGYALRGTLIQPDSPASINALLSVRPRWIQLAPIRQPVVGGIRPFDLARWEERYIPLVPNPKWVEFTPLPFRLGRGVNVWLEGEEPELMRIARQLTKFLEQRFYRQVRLHIGSPPVFERQIRLGLLRGKSLEWLTAQHPELARRIVMPEGYLLVSGAEGVTVLGADVRGLFYGTWRLKKLIRVSEDGSVLVDGVRMHDEPEFPFRGVHLVADDYSLVFHGQMIERVLAPMHFNHIILQCEYTRWESHPEIVVSFAMPKEEARQLKRIAEENFMELIPLVPSLGHCEYLFANNQNRDFVEDPQRPYAYCPSNERSYKVIFDIFQEALDLFQPKYFHIGHDEVANQGRFAWCPRCASKSPWRLYAEDVKRLYDFLASKGVKVMMWGDMLLRPGEASDAALGGEPFNIALARPDIPRDIIICDWHYQPARSYPSVNVFLRDGFKGVIGATWHNPNNIYTFARYAMSAKAMGMLQTTWTGFGGNRQALSKHPHQLVAYVVAGDYFWNTSSPPPDLLPYSPREAFYSLWKDLEVPPRPGFALDLTDLTNTFLSGGAHWLGYDNHDLRGLSGGFKRFRNTLFFVGGGSSQPVPVLMLAGRLVRGAPNQASFEINERVEKLTFLHGCAFEVPEGTEVGSYEIVFSGGQRHRLPLIYGQNIRAWDDVKLLPDTNAFIFWQKRSPSNPLLPVAVYGLKVSLPEERDIHSLHFISARTQASPFLVAMTGVSKTVKGEPEL